MLKPSRNRNSVKIILDFTGFAAPGEQQRHSIFDSGKKAPFLSPPKLPALRAEADGLSRLWSFYQDHA